MSEQQEPVLCCHLSTPHDLTSGCNKPAEFEIWNPPDPYDVTQACADHVGHLLTDNRCEVWPFQQSSKKP